MENQDIPHKVIDVLVARGGISRIAGILLDLDLLRIQRAVVQAVNPGECLLSIVSKFEFLLLFYGAFST